MFDTGDLTVARSQSGYRIDYRSNDRTQVVWLKVCDAPAKVPLTEASDARVISVACEGEGTDHAWPIRVPVFVEQ